jgi:hypothetical protein
MKIFGWELTKAKDRSEQRVVLARGSDQEDIGGEKSINFTIYSAEGGFVMQRSQYDPRSDRLNRKLFLIPESSDIAEEVGNIIKIEMLRL